MMKEVSVSKFKATCLELLRIVEETGEPVLVTKHGRPVAEVRAPQKKRAQSPFGCMKDRTEILGDIIAPAVPYEEWEVLVSAILGVTRIIHGCLPSRRRP